eukprot:6353126-Pyramimonas_sp.AAC.1
MIAYSHWRKPGRACKGGKSSYLRFSSCRRRGAAGWVATDRQVVHEEFFSLRGLDGTAVSCRLCGVTCLEGRLSGFGMLLVGWRSHHSNFANAAFEFEGQCAGREGCEERGALESWRFETDGWLEGLTCSPLGVCEACTIPEDGEMNEYSWWFRGDDLGFPLFTCKPLAVFCAACGLVGIFPNGVGEFCKLCAGGPRFWMKSAFGT